MGFKTPQVEITTLADIPAGTGLGSSGSFTTALLKALYTHRRRHLNQMELAELACHIEIDRLGEPVGKQDQYIAAVGGVTCFTFHTDDTVAATPLAISMDTMFDLEDNLLLFFTGFSRNAGSILKDQNTRTKQSDGGDAQEPPLRQGAGASKQTGAREGEHPSLRRADARALGAQEDAVPGA